MHRGMAQFPVRSVENSGEAKVSQIGNHVCGHFVSLSLVFTWHIRSDGRPNQNIYTFYITESTTTGCNEIPYAGKNLNERYPWPSSATDGSRQAVACVPWISRSIWVNKCWNGSLWSNHFDIYHTIMNRSCTWSVGFHLTPGCAFLACYFI